jgi:hypothetical protein
MDNMGDNTQGETEGAAGRLGAAAQGAREREKENARSATSTMNGHDPRRERGANAAPPGKRVALALGGGSARGLAHVLMLEVFDELGIKPTVIAGTSMGAICGAAYAAGLSGAEVRTRCTALFANRAAFLRHFAGKLRGGFSNLWSARMPSVVDNVTLFEMLLPEALRCDFAALKIPFLAIAADFYAIEQVVLDRGPLIPALAASSAPRRADADRRGLRQPAALRRGARPRRRDGCRRCDGAAAAPARGQAAAPARCGHRLNPDPVPLHHPRKAQGNSAPHFDSPERGGGGGAGEN